MTFCIESKDELNYAAVGRCFECSETKDRKIDVTDAQWFVRLLFTLQEIIRIDRSVKNNNEICIVARSGLLVFTDN